MSLFLRRYKEAGWGLGSTNASSWHHLMQHYHTSQLSDEWLGSRCDVELLPELQKLCFKLFLYSEHYLV